MPRLLDVIIRDAVIGSRKEIINLVNNYKLFNGNVLIFFKDGHFLIVGKAVQKLELLARFSQIFEDKLKRDSKGFQLYLSLHQFCMIAMSFEITSDQLTKLDKAYGRMIQLIFELDNDTKIWAKLHMIGHYSELVKGWRPLAIFSTIKYERKHSFF